MKIQLPISKTVLASIFLLAAACSNLKQQYDRKPTSIPEETTIESDNTSVNSDPLLEIARSPLDHDGVITCAYSKLLQEELSSVSDSDLRSQFQEELSIAKKDYAQDKDSNRHVRRLKRMAIHDLEILSRSTDHRNILNHAFSDLCSSGVFFGGASIRTTALAASTLTSALHLPIRFIYRFGRGVFTRTKENANHQPSFLGLVGTNNGRGLIYSSYKMIRLTGLSGSNPLLASTLIAPLIDFQSAVVCDDINNKNQNEVRFCKHYRMIKDLATASSLEGEKLGSKVRTIFNHQFPTHKNVCKKDPHEQMIISNEVIEEHGNQWKAQFPEMSGVITIPPPAGACVSIGVEVKDEDALIEISKSLGSNLDGLPIVYHVGAFQFPPKQDWTDPNADICALLYEAKINGLTDSIKDERRDEAELLLNPSRFSKPKTQEVNVPDEHLVRQSAVMSKKLRNVILTLSLSESEKEEAEQLKTDYSILKKQLKAGGKAIKQLLKASTLEECHLRKNKIGFDYAHYQELINSKTKYEIDDKLTQAEYLANLEKNAGKKFGFLKTLKHNWEVIPSSQIQDVISFAQADDIGNLIVVGHGVNNGKFVDSHYNELSTNAFEQIAPSITSLSFYTCIGNQVFETYSLKDKLSKGPSFNKLRAVFSVSSHDLLKGEADVAPAPGLSSFIEKIDNQIDLIEIGNQRVQTIAGSKFQNYSAPNECKLNLKGFEVTQGGFGFVLNRKLIGIVGTEGLKDAISFPCDWILAANNTLMIQNQNLRNRSTTAHRDFEFFITTPSQTLELNQPENFAPWDDGSYRGGKYHF